MPNSTRETVPIEEYEALKKEYEEFTYIVSHDFNVPTRHIREFSRLLLASLDGSSSEEQQKYAAFIEKSVRRNETMLEALLQLSRLNTQAHEYSDVDCNDIVDGILKHKADKISEGGIQITCSELPVIRGEQKQIMNLFYNLIDNAIKFRRKDVVSIINISAEKQDSNWLFCVSDNGIGIEKAHQDQIFKLFRKLSSNDEYAGAGTGLTLSKKIIDIYAKKLWVESEPNKGSKFFFTFSAT